jgi:hypothetical protein
VIYKCLLEKEYSGLKLQVSPPPPTSYVRMNIFIWYFCCRLHIPLTCILEVPALNMSQATDSAEVFCFPQSVPEDARVLS